MNRNVLEKVSDFPLGEENTAFAQYFIGKSYLSPLNKEEVSIFNVTFEPGCRNNWHIHHDGGQILICVGGHGWYQEYDKEPQLLK
ncbi:MAG: cupin domain-containing protein, partial [Bacillus sp. (in: firmicutes)]